MDMEDLQGSSSEEALKVEPEDTPPRSNQELSLQVTQEPVEEEKGGWRERMANATTRNEVEFWLGFHDTPENTEEFEHLAHGLDMEAENGNQIG